MSVPSAHRDNVILHVVWEYDTPVFRKNNVEISVLEIKNYVAKEALEQYFNLTSKKNWIYCENQLKDVNLFILKNFQEKLLAMKAVKGKPVAFAITLEKAGGSPTPTLEEMYVMGEV